jgi:hypothetical protein
MSKKAGIHTTHYTSEIITGLTTGTMWGKSGLTRFEMPLGVANLVRLLRESTKFSLGQLVEGEYVTYAAVNEIRPHHLFLPYQVVALEFGIPYLDDDDRETYMPTVMLMAQLSMDSPAMWEALQHFDLRPGFRDMEQEGYLFLLFSHFEDAWMLHNLAGVMCPPSMVGWEKAKRSGISKLKQETIDNPEAVVLEAVVLDPDDIPVGETAEGFVRNWCKQISMELRTMANFLYRLHQRKARVQVFAAPAKLNRKRIKRGKEPFYEYRVLTVDPDAPNVEIINPVKRHHKSPKLHVRRGHWRQYKSGKRVWVDQMLVGNPDRGVVIKDYEVK